MLNDVQKQAVEHVQGPLVVFAGAGSGKTRVITHRAAYLIREAGVPPHRILAVTFTNKAANEMRERLATIVPEAARWVWMGTFHSICARLLRDYAAEAGVDARFVIYDDSDQRAMLSHVVRDLKLDEGRFDPKSLAQAINRARQELITPEQYGTHTPYDERVRQIYQRYEERMLEAKALDFGDLIYRLVLALERSGGLRQVLGDRFQYVLVDEFQDTNRAQWRLLQLLCEAHHNLCVVGDDDQSIYRWRGADRRNILDFRRTFPNAVTIKLEQNYRSTARILRAATHIISRSDDREPKTLWTENADGEPISVVTCRDEREEARLIAECAGELIDQGVSGDDFAVFYRVHSQSRVLEEALRGRDIAYRIVGGTRFYERAEVKDILAYLRVIINPDDPVALLRIINTPARGIGKVTIDRIVDAAAQSGRGMWAAVRDHAEHGSGTRAAPAKLKPFIALIEELQAKAAQGERPYQLAMRVTEGTGYMQALREQDSPEADARIQNIEEFLGSVSEFEAESETPTLSAFLERITLQTEHDNPDSHRGRVSLMTVHAAKGLEFPVVWVAGLEEGLFPYRRGGNNSWMGGDDEDDVEEERRLAYVAITRARQKLFLSHAQTRHVFGQIRINTPSRFLDEVPEEDCVRIGERGREPARDFVWDEPTYSGWNDAAERRSAARSTLQRRAPNERHLEPDVDTSDSTAWVGRQVRHPKFGIGRIQQVAGGDPPKVVVRFADAGIKTIIASFLQPA